MRQAQRPWWFYLLNAALPLGCSVLVVVVMLRSLVCTPGYLIYRDFFPGQLYYPSLWHPQGSFMAIENYKFVTYTGLFLPLRALGLDIYEKAVYISAVAIAGLASYLAAFRLLARLGGASLSLPARHIACMLAAVTYVANPAAASIFFDFSLFVGYAFAPLVLTVYLEMLDGRCNRSLAVVGVAGLWWLSAIKAHWIVFGALLLIPPLVISSIRDWRRRNRSRLIRNALSTAAIVAVYLLLSAYWLAPFLLTSRERFVGSYAPMTYESLAYLSSAPLIDTVRMLGTFQAWPYVLYEPPSPAAAIPWTVSSWIIPAASVFALIGFRRRWQAWALAAFAAGGILLAKGVAPPLEEVYYNLVFGGLTPAPLRWLFRVASKWNVFTSLGCSLLVALALARLGGWGRWSRRRAQRRLTPWLAIAGYGGALLLFCWPSFTGDFRGSVVPAPLPDALPAVNRWLAEQAGDFKVNWMPVTNGRELSWNRRPSGEVYTSLSSRPSIGTNWNRQPVLYYSYAYDAVAGDRTATLGKLLSVLDTRYVVYHDDVVSSHIHEGVEPVAVLIEEGEQKLADQIARQRDMRSAWNQGFITAFQNLEPTAPLFIPQRTYLAAGDLSVLTSLDAFEGFQPARNALLFDGAREMAQYPAGVDGVLLGRDAPLQVAIAQLPINRLLSPAAQTNHGDVTRAWSRYDIYQFDWQAMLRDQGINLWSFDYGQGMVAHASDARQADASDASAAYPILEIPARVETQDTYHLLVRQLHHARMGELVISVDGRSAAALGAHDPITGFVWEDAGAVDLAPGGHVIGIQNRDGFNAVNALAVLSSSELAAVQARGEAWASRLANLYLLEAEADFDTGRAQPARKSVALSNGSAVVVDGRSAISAVLNIVSPGAYTVGVRAVVPQPAAGVTVTLGRQVIALSASGSQTSAAWLTAGPVALERGPLTVTIGAAGPAVVDAFLLSSSPPSASSPDALFADAPPPAEMAFEQLDPTRYRVSVRADRPFILALAETYDPLWVASGPDVSVSSLPLYGVINGFYIERPGAYDLVVEYLPQQWARLGTLLTAGVLVVLLLLLPFTRRRPARR